MMGLKELLVAFGFMMIFESLMPMISPRRWKRALSLLQQVPDSAIQKLGIVGVLCGLAVIWLLKTDIASL